jgi:hypothetical protein
MKYSSKTFNPLKAMKKLAICVALTLVCASANAQNKVFDKLAKMKGVEYTHVDKEMIKLAAKQGEGLHVGEVVNLGQGEGEEVLNQFDDVKVFVCDKGGDIKKFQKVALKLLKGKEWEPLIDTKGDDGEIVKIYLSKKGEQSTNVILAIEEDETTLVVISGTFDLSKMMQQDMNMNVGVNN